MGSAIGLSRSGSNAVSELVSNEHLNRDVLIALKDVMEDEFALLLETFLVDSQERLHALQAAWLAADAQALRCAAHSFKGSCGNIGAPSLAALCAKLEAVAGAGELSGVATWLERIAHEFEIVEALLEAELQR
jgi:HPt (histidine-containing phosphotransfer) domain-containing protein